MKSVKSSSRTGSTTVSKRIELKSKLFSTLADDSRKALVLRVNSKEALAGGINAKLDELQQTLDTLNAKNCLLIIVAEKKVKGQIRTSSKRVVRYVKEFNPQQFVAKADLGDPIGWNAIFTEFAPAVIKAATHKFKFEE